MLTNYFYIVSLAERRRDVMPEPNVASKDTESPLYHKASFVINVFPPEKSCLNCDSCWVLLENNYCLNLFA